MIYYYIAIVLSILLFVSTTWIVLLSRKHSDTKRKLEFLIEVVYQIQGGDDND